MGNNVSMNGTNTNALNIMSRPICFEKHVSNVDKRLFLFPIGSSSGSVSEVSINRKEEIAILRTSPTSKAVVRSVSHIIASPY
jgi:hypothetical protein